ncbi:hypothetical protein BpHYR1_032977 [Brachionus plicatilis]|uniref:Uncharacterized protein n=1 Tax=Brachionus plicatilis TaxID=10195 RepID=A0A3M7RFM4_BRAPC|nr:hypothetical protein BpHYR1_032977 [Brachionus plicatilis]
MLFCFLMFALEQKFSPCYKICIRGWKEFQYHSGKMLKTCILQMFISEQSRKYVSKKKEFTTIYRSDLIIGCMNFQKQTTFQCHVKKTSILGSC